MFRIREYEEAIAEKYSQQKMRCPTHLSIGQEAVPAALSALLTHQDLAISTHRAHAHYLGKGGDGKKFIAEIYGKETGCAKGRGGSMHLIDLEVGFKGSTAIVGNSIPIGVGLALAEKLNNSDNIVVVYLGDGATEEGAFYEAVNFAAVKKLPVLFVCENNLYSVYSPLSVRQPNGRKIHAMVEAMGVTVNSDDGNNVSAIFETAQAAIEKIRNGEGPQFLEYSTYRWREHCGPNYDNHIGYRTEQEFLDWKERDPVKLYADYLTENSLFTSDEVDAVRNQVLAEVEEAFVFAEESEFPSKDSAFDYIFKSESGAQ